MSARGRMGHLHRAAAVAGNGWLWLQPVHARPVCQSQCHVREAAVSVFEAVRWGLWWRIRLAAGRWTDGGSASGGYDDGWHGGRDVLDTVPVGLHSYTEALRCRSSAGKFRSLSSDTLFPCIKITLLSINHGVHSSHFLHLALTTYYSEFKLRPFPDTTG